MERVLDQGVEGVLDEEGSYRRLPEIDGGTPWSVDVAAEEVRRVAAEIVPVRPEVIVNDIEEHHQVALVRRVNQGLEIVRRAVGTIRCEGQHAVVTPVARSGKIVDRHEFDGGDADSSEAIEICVHTGKAAI